MKGKVFASLALVGLSACDPGWKYRVGDGPLHPSEKASTYEVPIEDAPIRYVIDCYFFGGLNVVSSIRNDGREALRFHLRDVVLRDVAGDSIPLEYVGADQHDIGNGFRVIEPGETYEVRHHFGRVEPFEKSWFRRRINRRIAKLTFENNGIEVSSRRLKLAATFRSTFE